MDIVNIIPKPRHPLVRILCYLQEYTLPNGAETIRLFDKETGCSVSFAIGSIESAREYASLMNDIAAAAKNVPFSADLYRQFGQAYVILSGSMVENRDNGVVLSIEDSIHFEIRNHTF